METQDKAERRQRKASAPRPEDAGQPVTPRAAARPIVPTADEWREWCDNPVTAFVAAGFAATAELNRRKWTEASWEGGVAAQALLDELRTRHDVNRQFLDCTKEDYLAAIHQI